MYCFIKASYIDCLRRPNAYVLRVRWCCIGICVHKYNNYVTGNELQCHSNIEIGVYKMTYMAEW